MSYSLSAVWSHFLAAITAGAETKTVRSLIFLAPATA